MPTDIILLAKTERFSRDAASIAEVLFGERLTTFTGQVGDPLPDALGSARPQYVLSFLSPWIVPQQLLDASGAALNFHPASRDYPGIGCYNFALYDEAPEFGAVCHHMVAKVDSGAIVEERRFPLVPSDTVETLKLRTMVTLLSLFHDICCTIARGGPLPVAEASWSRRPYTRREMNALREITPGMDPDEVRRRVRAMTYPGYPGPTLVMGEVSFEHRPPDRPPLA
jgi:methionyl-tRNA formyltransferase